MTATRKHDDSPSSLDLPGNAPPDFFTGTSLTVDQLAIDLQCLMTHLRGLRMSHGGRSATGMKLAAESAAKLLGQMQGSASHLVTVSVHHLARRPRA